MDPTEKELLRHAVLECLAIRHPAALTPPGIRRRVATEMGGPVELADIDGALAILKGANPPLAESVEDELGRTTYWAATTAGVLLVERGQ